jgi:chromosome segregation ATPase
MPKLEALRNEKRSFLAFQKATSELERLLRLVKAYEWLEASKREAKSGETLETKKASLEEKKQLLVWLGNKQTKMEKEMGEILKKREKVSLVTQATCINRFRRWKRKGRLADRVGMGGCLRRWRKEGSSLA